MSLRSHKKYPQEYPLAMRVVAQAAHARWVGGDAAGMDCSEPGARSASVAPRADCREALAGTCGALVATEEGQGTSSVISAEVRDSGS